MGSATSETVLFIGAMVVATMVVAALGTAVVDVADGLGKRGRSLGQALRSDVVVINDPGNVATSPLTLYAKNTGSANLLASETTLLFDGTPAASVTFDVLASTDDATWRPGQVLKMTTSEFTVASGDHLVKIVADTGAEARFEFNKP